LPKPEFEPIILSCEWTADLYRLVIFSVEPGKRIGAIVGPRGASDDQVKEAIRNIARNIKT